VFFNNRFHHVPPVTPLHLPEKQTLTCELHVILDADLFITGQPTLLGFLWSPTDSILLSLSELQESLHRQGYKISIVSIKENHGKKTATSHITNPSYSLEDGKKREYIYIYFIKCDENRDVLSFSPIYKDFMFQVDYGGKTARSIA
jgi:hypothetical protein